MNEKNVNAAIEVAKNPEAFLSSMDAAALSGGVGLLALAVLAAVIFYFANQ